MQCWGDHVEAPFGSVASRKYRAKALYPLSVDFVGQHDLDSQERHTLGPDGLCTHGAWYF